MAQQRQRQNKREHSFREEGISALSAAKHVFIYNIFIHVCLYTHIYKPMESSVFEDNLSG